MRELLQRIRMLVGVAALTMVPALAVDAQDVRRPKKLIATGWDKADTQRLRQNLEQMERRPFDRGDLRNHRSRRVGPPDSTPLGLPERCVERGVVPVRNGRTCRLQVRAVYRQLRAVWAQFQETSIGSTTEVGKRLGPLADRGLGGEKLRMQRHPVRSGAVCEAHPQFPLHPSPQPWPPRFGGDLSANAGRRRRVVKAVVTE